MLMQGHLFTHGIRGETCMLPFFFFKFATMRVYTVRKGKFAGTHYVFDNVEEYKKYFPTEEPKKWGDLSIQVNDWVIADDGYVLQCLRITKLSNMVLYRFCNGSFYYSLRKDGSVNVKTFYGAYTYDRKDSFGVNARNVKTKLFESYLRAGYSPIEAVKKIERKNFHPSTLRKVLAKYLHRSNFMEALINSNAINDRIQQITGKTIPELVEQEIMRQLQGLNTNELSLKEGREIVKFLYQLFGKSKKDTIEEVDAVEEKPPLLE